MIQHTPLNGIRPRRRDSRELLRPDSPAAGPPEAFGFMEQAANRAGRRRPKRKNIYR